MRTISTEISLGDLNGENGFSITDGDALSRLGTSVSSAGDINGDGIDDFIIGAPRGRDITPDAGSSYIVFGDANGFNSNLDLTTLDGSNGFRLIGQNRRELSGSSVSSAGDVNGDGIGDLIVGAPSSRFAGFDENPGSSYVVFGQSFYGSGQQNVSDLDGSNGFAIRGRTVGDRLGASVSSAGDVNGDGIDDLIVGAPRSSPDDQNRIGESYVVFGQRTQYGQRFNQEIGVDDLNGTNGFKIIGDVAGDASGFSVASAGDVNGDGIDDLIVGAPLAGGEPDRDGEARPTFRSGKSYVVFGKSQSSQPFSSTFDLTSIEQGSSDGFVISSNSDDDRLGESVGVAGDINGDGFDDLLIGAELEGGAAEFRRSNDAYVIYGGQNLGGSKVNIDLLTGANGFVINTNGGYVVSSGAGDTNGDGFDDLILGTPDREGSAGSGFLLYGGNSIDDQGRLEVSDDFINGENGFKFTSSQSRGKLGASVSSAGDVNNDGLDDIIIGAPDIAESYVIYGQGPDGQSPGCGDACGVITGTDQRDTLTGTDGDDIIIGMEGNDRLTGGGGMDQFVYRSVDDRRDRITDFEVGQDKIVLSDILRPLGVNSYEDAVDNGYLEIRSSLSGSTTRVRIDADGFGNSQLMRTLLSVGDVPSAELDSADNFVI